MTKFVILPMVAAAALSVTACSKGSEAATEANLSADNGAAFETAGDNIAAVDDAVANDAALPLDNAAAPLDAANAGDNAADSSIGNAQ